MILIGSFILAVSGYALSLIALVIGGLGTALFFTTNRDVEKDAGALMIGGGFSLAAITAYLTAFALSSL